jgi:small-conductance mechanosensitive channel
MLIVPNSNIMTGVVKNWVRGDKVGRIKVPVTVNTGVDPEKVRDALIEVARAHEQVLKLPAPNVLFTSMTANGINFELVCFLADVETSMRITSDLNFAIFRRFRDAGFELMSTSALPPVASVTGFDHLNAYLARAGDARAPSGQNP